jgi:hypothetical protein
MMDESTMRISFNQPAFIPWGGFFARLLYSDKIVLLDETALAHGFTYVNRNRIKGPEGEVWITVPLKRKGRSEQKIKDLEIYEKGKWARKFLPTLKHFYGKSVCFEPVYQEIKEAVESPGESFMSLVLLLLDIINRNFEIHKEAVLQSKIGITGKGTTLLVAVAKELGAREVVLPYFSEKAVEVDQFNKEKIQVRFLRYLPPAYPQFWGGFEGNLSALDLLLCLGGEGKAVIEKGTKILS